ncbi:MAG: RluA family pseudouridine synthase [Candidatus Moraniibacteriota bacterium]
MDQRITFFVKEKHNGWRLDHFLVEARADLTRPVVQTLIASDSVTIAGKLIIRPGLRLKPGMVVHLDGMRLTKQQNNTEELAASLKPTVIAETEAFLVLSKPAGIAMHPAGNLRQLTVTDWISTTYPQIMGIGEEEKRPGMVHRLDKDTSGLVLIAKTPKAFKALKKLFQERQIEKTYFALVHGNLSEPSGSINLPIGRVKGEKKRSVPAGKREFGGELREAVTEYALHTRYTGYDYVSVKPKTGRTHQIRVHLSVLGHPIVGDRLYRFKEHRRDTLKPPFQLLHAAELRFQLGRHKYRYEAPLPRYFRDTLKMLDAEAGRGYDWNA